MRPLVDIESRHAANRSRVFAWTAVALLPLAFVAGLSLSDAEAAPKTKAGFYCKGPLFGAVNADGETTALVAVGSKGCEEVLRAAVTR